MIIKKTDLLITQSKKKYTLSINLRYLVLISSILFCGVGMSFGNAIVDVAVLWFLCAIAIFLSNWDLLHPYFCYSVGFSLYATGYPILCIMDGNIGSISPELMPLNLLAYSTFLIIMMPKNTNYKRAFIHDLPWPKYELSRLKIIIIILALFIVVFFYFFVFRAGITRKGEINYVFIYRVWMLAGSVLLHIYAIAIMVFYKSDYTNIKKMKSAVLIFVVCGISLFLIGTTGERDFWFRFVGVSILSFYATGLLKNRHFIILVPMIFALVSLSVAYKYFFLSGYIAESDTGLFERFLRADFFAASKNLQILISHRLNSYLSPLSLIDDFLPWGGLIGWFSSQYMEASYGMGFTIVGTGYVTAGVPGIIIVMTIVSLIIKFMYLLSSRSPYYFTAYITFMLTCIYACRGSLSTVVTSAGTSISIALMSTALLKDADKSNTNATDLKRFVFGAMLFVLVQSGDLLVMFDNM